MMFRDQVVVVSGVGAGLGQALVSALVREGARVVLAARSMAMLESVAGRLPEAQTLCIATDITLAADCRRLAKRTSERFGRVDALINNAFQLGPRGLLAEADLNEDWSQAFEVNVKGSVRMVQALLPALTASQGAVVMVNTIAARCHKPGFASYAISKGALQTATRTLAMELAPRGVRVNAVIPGYIDGPPLQDAFAAMAEAEGVAAEDIRRRVADSLPLRCIPTSEDVAEAALFLASRRVRGITGAALDINAGEHVPL
ncbi:MAG: SDR family oxidoreductase [Gammaproteobacteria bacterium]|nr:SDR family oxidoreductase [Gammaproteobacteria bacterium]